MTLAPKIEIYFGDTETPADVFVFDDPVKGKFDDATYVFGGTLLAATDISDTVYELSITRGRSRELDEMQAGVCAVKVVNYDGRFLPVTLADPYLRTEAGEIITDELGDPILVERTLYGSNATPGKRVRISVYDIPIFDGIIESWDYGFESSGRVEAMFTAADALAALARKSFDAWTATASQTAGPRLSAILDRSEVAYGANRDLDPGISTLQGDAISWGSNVLSYAQLVVRSDQGRLFAAANGVLTFRDRHSLIDDGTPVQFADDGTAIGFAGVKVATSSELLANRVSVDREGGTAQTTENATSIAKYGVRQLSIGGLLLDSDVQSGDMADWLAGIYSEPPTRISSLTVNLDGLTAAQQAQVLALDLAHVVEVTWTPTGGDQYVQTSVVEGIAHTSTRAGLHVVELTLSPLTGTQSMIFDDPVSGLFDSNVFAF